MITCHLTKLELALDQVKKSYPKLKPADAGLIAQAISLTGRHALAEYDGRQYTWPEEYNDLTRALIGQIEMAQEAAEPVAPVKKSAKTTVEEEPIQLALGLVPNLSAGEKVLANRNDLKTLLSDMVQEGVEYVYSGTDIGWQWALDRANWTTIVGGDLTRKVKVKATFTAGAIGIEMGTTTKKKPAGKASKAAAVVEEVEDVVVLDEVALDDIPEIPEIDLSTEVVEETEE